MGFRITPSLLLMCLLSLSGTLRAEDDQGKNAALYNDAGINPAMLEGVDEHGRFWFYYGVLVSSEKALLNFAQSKVVDNGVRSLRDDEGRLDGFVQRTLSRLRVAQIGLDEVVPHIEATGQRVLMHRHIVGRNLSAVLASDEAISFGYIGPIAAEVAGWYGDGN